MNRSKKTIFTVLIVISMLLSGCTEASNEATDEIDDNMPLPDCELDNSCIDDTVGNDGGNEILEIPHSDGCDNINPIHCMLPFPSNAFLVDDSTTVTGKRINYAADSLPGSGSKSVIEIPLINQMDGFSTSTQIITAFSSIPIIDILASQNNIALSMNSGHQTMLVNMDTGDLVEHWVELDARAEEGEAVILHIRTIKHLEFNTEYGVLVHGLSDGLGELIEPSQALSAIMDGNATDSSDIEDRRGEISLLIDYFTEEKNVEKSGIQAIWSFTTNSAESAFCLLYTSDAADE